MIKPRAMRDALLENIWQAMDSNEKIFFVSADFGSPVLDRIRSDHPTRFVNVGVAEQNLINVSAGLALEGYQVFAYAIAPFITMRCFEQIRVSLALLSEVRQMNVNLIGVGAGYSYVMSGPTHQCYEDITLMRSLPNFQVFSPADHRAAGSLFQHCIEQNGPKYLRLDAQVLPTIYADETPSLKRGFHVHHVGDTTCVIATGYMVHTALEMAGSFRAQGNRVGVIDLFDLARFDRVGLIAELRKYTHLVTMEEGFHGRGGMDSMLFELITQHDLGLKMLNLGIDGKYRFDLGSRVELHEKAGIGPISAGNRISSFQEK